MPAKLLKEDFLFYLKKNLEKVGLGREGGGGGIDPMGTVGQSK